MIEYPKKIRRIYMVSSAVFSAASGIYGWLAPFGAALGLVVNLTEDNAESSINEFNRAVEIALGRTKKAITRYGCAELAAQYVVSHIKRQEFGNVLDFYYAIEKESVNPTFRLGYLNQYIKAVSPVNYQKYQQVFDDMTQKK